MGEFKGVMGGVTSMVAGVGADGDHFVPWHYKYNEHRVKLHHSGKIKSGRQALTMAGLDWNVVKESLATYMPGREGADDFCVLVREDNGGILGIGSNGNYEEATGKGRKGYTTIRNMAVGDMGDAIMEVVPDASILTAGALFDPGRVVWMLVEIPSSATYFGSNGARRMERFVLISTTHNGSGAFTLRSTNVEVQCMNTYSMAFNGARADYTIRHTSGAEGYLAEARKGIAVVQANFDAMDVEIERLLAEELDEFDFLVDVVPAVFGPQPPESDKASRTKYGNKVAALQDIYGAEHNKDISGTKFAALTTINEYEVWGITPRGRSVQEQQMSRLLTSNYPLTQKALAVIG